MFCSNLFLFKVEQKSTVEFIRETDLERKKQQHTKTELMKSDLGFIFSPQCF